MSYRAITEMGAIEKAFEEMKAGFSSSAEVFADRAVGFQGGAHCCNVFWNSELKFWGLFEDNKVDGRYWICFGRENPAKTSNLTITVEINPPREGINRRCAGVFVRDAADKTHIAHSGGIGGGRKGIGKKAFREFASNQLWADVTWPDGKQSDHLIIGEIGADNLDESLSRFVNLVADFKKAAISGYGLQPPKIKPKREAKMTFSGLLTRILVENSDGLTPQQIREIIKSDYAEFYGTDSHKRNVEKGHYKDLDHALLASIYATASNSKRVRADRTQKPAVLFHVVGAAPPKSTVGRPRKKRKSHKTIQLQDMATPKPNLIREYLTKWEQLENYKAQDVSLKLLFHTMCPQNQATEQVLLKVSTLNDFYSTHIFDTYAVAKHIVELDVDQRLERSDYSLVNDIAAVKVGDSVKNFYSFASKFCSHHKPDYYPIYDSYVETMLVNYKDNDSFDRFAKNDLKYYPHFVKIIKAFREFYGLSKFGLRDIDRFLWLAGKEWFPKNY